MTYGLKIADRMGRAKKLTRQKYDSFRRDLERSGFALPERIRASLQTDGMEDSAAAEALLEWDGLFLHPNDYRERDAARIIRAAPSFWESVVHESLPFRYTPAWEDRTVESLVMRQWEEMWRSEEEPDSLLDLVRRYMIEFLPTVAGAAPEVRDILPRLGERPELSEVFCVMRTIDSFKPEPLVPRASPTLDSVEAELQSLGADYFRDLRPLPSPSDLLSNPVWRA